MSKIEVVNAPGVSDDVDAAFDEAINTVMDVFGNRVKGVLIMVHLAAENDSCGIAVGINKVTAGSDWELEMSNLILGSPKVIEKWSERMQVIILQKKEPKRESD